MSEFDRSLEIALRTWYPEDDPLHFNAYHPLGKLLGELGELLDDYMKSLYKANYTFEPLDELGDVWYYLRILYYQYKYHPSKHFTEIVIEHLDGNMLTDNTGYLITYSINHISRKFLLLMGNKKDDTAPMALDIVYACIWHICREYNFTLQQLPESNWEKLKPGSERGGQWAESRDKVI